MGEIYFGKKKQKQIPVKKILFNVSLIYLSFTVIYWAIVISIKFHKFSIAVFTSPVKYIFNVASIYIILFLVLIAVNFIMFGIQRSKLWYLLPAGIFLFATYWHIANLLLLKFIDKLPM